MIIFSASCILSKQEIKKITNKTFLLINLFSNNSTFFHKNKNKNKKVKFLEHFVHKGLIQVDLVEEKKNVLSCQANKSRLKSRDFFLIKNLVRGLQNLDEKYRELTYSHTHIFSIFSKYICTHTRTHTHFLHLSFIHTHSHKNIRKAQTFTNI